jgi:hypothetical protein
MSKVVRVTDSDYKIVTQLDGTITLDTGAQIGRVIITGDLIVEGNTSTIESETLTVKDNIIYLNQYPPEDYEPNTSTPLPIGVALGSAGISIDRGAAVDVSLLFDETTDTFRFIDALGTLVPFQSNSITTGSGDLRIFTGSSGNGVISVTGVPNYELRCTDDDDIPNVRFVYDYVLAVGGVAVVDRFYAYSGATTLNTGGRAYDTGAGDGSSRVSFEVDGAVITEINSAGLSVVGAINVDQVQITDNFITTTNSNNNLELKANGSGLVLVDSVLGLSSQGIEPNATAGQTKIYSSNTVGTGGTGVYFKNTSQTGEFISSKKALLYALLF